MDYGALAVEIAQPVHAGRTDAEIAAALTAATVTRHRDVPTADARRLLQRSGEWGAIALLARSTPGSVEQGQAVAIAITALAALASDGWQDLAMTDPADRAAVVGMLDGLVSAGVVSAATREALLALEHEDVPVWGVVTEHDVAHARSLIDAR